MSTTASDWGELHTSGGTMIAVINTWHFVKRVGIDRLLYVRYSLIEVTNLYYVFLPTVLHIIYGAINNLKKN